MLQRNSTRRPYNFFRQLMRQQGGLAYLEFALLAPMLITLFLGGMEITRYVQASQKVDKVTHTIVDLIAQAPTISTNDLDQIMAATEHIMRPLDFPEDGVIIVSCVGYDENGQLIIKWQYKGGGALARDSLIGEEAEAPVLPQGFVVENRDNVIIAETFFTFEPMINDRIIDPIEFYRTAFYLPRLGELDTLAQN